MATPKPSAGAGSSAGDVKDPAEKLENLIKLSFDDAMAEPIRLFLSGMRTEHSHQAPTTTKNSRTPTCGTEVKAREAVILETLVKLSADKAMADPIRLILSGLRTEHSPKNSRKPTRKTGKAHKNKKIKEHKNWECHVCHRTFNHLSNFRRHVKSFHPDEQMSKQTRENKSKSEAPKKKRWPCEWCKKTFCSDGNLKRHLKSCRSKVDYEDNEDGRNSSNAEDQPEDGDEESVSSGHEDQVRESEEDPGPIIYVCEECKAAAIDMDTAVEHSQIHQVPGYVPDLETCEVCRFMFETQHFDDHSPIHDHIDDAHLIIVFDPIAILDNNWPERIRVTLETSAMDIETSKVQQEG